MANDKARERANRPLKMDEKVLLLKLTYVAESVKKKKRELKDREAACKKLRAELERREAEWLKSKEELEGTLQQRADAIDLWQSTIHLKAERANKADWWEINQERRELLDSAEGIDFKIEEDRRMLQTGLSTSISHAASTAQIVRDVMGKAPTGV
ncbi:uncharacterized protein AB675_3517 [Cyphellophora attinorum]|uniref:Uncharacterized protein n=1 Tax=Cyphellophora attinorum TaxID=1664694 RepID=A0A0N1HT83_9EURO|nr:uncharacterized protein AB675_3517 [Phialophora attinorum]KPI39645.1 hypothetical protein AB675_3517 [Phialophora attinorum]